jgi:hypothetical protein
VSYDNPASTAAAATLQATSDAADLVLRNARIFTGDPARPHAARSPPRTGASPLLATRPTSLP